MAEEDWEWVHSPTHRFQGSTSCDDEDDGYDVLFGRGNAGTANPTLLHLHTNATQFSENLSSTASSPILKHNLTATVMARECISALDALHHSVAEWIEPQLVFTMPHDYRLEGLEVYKVVTRLRNLANSKETLMSLLSDPNVCHAVVSNKAFQELACEHADDVGNRLKFRDSTSACDSCFGRKIYKLLKEKLMEVVDILLGTHMFENTVEDQHDEITKACIFLVAALVTFVIGKRSEEGLHLGHTL